MLNFGQIISWRETVLVGRWRYVPRPRVNQFWSIYYLNILTFWSRRKSQFWRFKKKKHKVFLIKNCFICIWINWLYHFINVYQPVGEKVLVVTLKNLTFKSEFQLFLPFLIGKSAVLFTSVLLTFTFQVALSIIKKPS